MTLGRTSPSAAMIYFAATQYYYTSCDWANQARGNYYETVSENVTTFVIGFVSRKECGSVMERELRDAPKNGCE